eukprot:CAMPEP_0117671772 /NCGR_PEP_ID=MMETSP0804-20121206/13530_1 /TAXON_ID=1074897 /ORGANISM="Tetraselmis astigmatica, Strain CCMP880" /LENGTH=452 /DNA_ID=CAMNT_0005480291 /DNA_START=414 /DNA_END=1773 /DNA_ORIENTATION=+
MLAPRPAGEAAVGDLSDLLAAADDDMDLDALLADLEPPALEGEPRYYQEAAGGQFENGVAVTFGNDAEALAAFEKTAVIVDRSHWGRIRVSGDDRMSFMHNQSTADFMNLKPGQGTDTVLVTPQARTIDIASAVVQEKGVLLIVSPGQAETLLQRLNKYIFPMDRVEIQDVSSKCGMLTIMGPGCHELLEEIKAEGIIGKPEGSHMLVRFGDAPVILIAGSGLRNNGYTMIVDESQTGALWRQLTMLGAVPMGSNMWEQVRILQGRPAPAAELTDQFNPLEAGLYHAVSLAKGCYIGQETLAKVHNLDAVKQQLWGLEMATRCAPGDIVTDADGNKLGTVTSVTTRVDNGTTVALAYLRCKSKGGKVEVGGIYVTVNGVTAQVVSLPYGMREFHPDSLPKREDKGDAAPAQAAKEDKAAEDAKAAKLKAMQERLAAYQAQVAAAKSKPDKED